MICPYCHSPDCMTREDCASAYARMRANDRAGFEHFTRGLPIKEAGEWAPRKSVKAPELLCEVNEL